MERSSALQLELTMAPSWVPLSDSHWEPLMGLLSAQHLASQWDSSSVQW